MQIKKEYIIKNLGDENFILVNKEDDLNLNKIISINQTGVFIFNKLKQGLGLDEIVNEMKKEYQVSKREVQQDIKEFVALLKDKNILD